MTGKLCLFRFDYLAEVFLKRKEVNLALQGQPLTILSLMIKFELSSKKSEIWKIGISTASLTASQYVKTFLMRSVALLMMRMEERGRNIMKCINVWKMYVTQ